MALEVSQPAGPATRAMCDTVQALSEGSTGAKEIEAVEPACSDVDHHRPTLPWEIVQHAAVRAVCQRRLNPPQK